MSNNSFFALEVAKEPQGEEAMKVRREEEARLIRILEAIKGLEANEDWCSLKKEILDGLTERLEKDLRIEAEQENPDPNKLNRFAGELKWARRFSDLKKLEDVYRIQLQAVRKNLN